MRIPKWVTHVHMLSDVQVTALVRVNTVEPISEDTFVASTLYPPIVFVQVASA